MLKASLRGNSCMEGHLGPNNEVCVIQDLCQNYTSNFVAVY